MDYEILYLYAFHCLRWCIANCFQTIPNLSITRVEISLRNLQKLASNNFWNKSSITKERLLLLGSEKAEKSRFYIKKTWSRRMQYNWKLFLPLRRSLAWKSISKCCFFSSAINVIASDSFMHARSFSMENGVYCLLFHMSPFQFFKPFIPILRRSLGGVRKKKKICVLFAFRHKNSLAMSRNMWHTVTHVSLNVDSSLIDWEQLSGS
jgi:hypothetical protein